MRQDFFDFEPTHKIFMAVNHKPHIRGTDTGIWRRIRLIPFSVEIPEHKQDRQLQEKLLKEAPGILAWAVQGCLAWQEHGLGMTTEIYEATNEYREEMDTIGAFIADCCIEGSGCKVKASELYQCYREWCERSGEHYVSQKEMSFYLGDRGYERKRLMNGYHWFGLGILEKHEPLDPTHERSFIVDKHNEGEGGSDSEKQNMNDHEPFSVSNQKSIDFQCYTENGSSRFINEKNDSPEVNSDKASEGMNDRSSQVVEHNGGLKEKLDEYLKKCPDSWVRMIQNSVKQNRFTSLGIAVEASRRMSNGDSQCAWRLIRQNGG
jgi:phage/plasmid-associated DNA primase